MILSDITETKKGRYALFCDNEFLFSIDEETFVGFSLYKGMELDENIIKELRQRSSIVTAKSKAIELLQYRVHSKKELYDKLYTRYDAMTAELVVDEMEKIGYIDDYSFTKDYLEYIFSKKFSSIRLAKNLLYERGISKEIYEELLTPYLFSEEERIIKLVKKKYKNALDSDKNYEKTFSALLRRGFTSSDIREALENIKSEE